EDVAQERRLTMRPDNLVAHGGQTRARIPRLDLDLEASVLGSWLGGTGDADRHGLVLAGEGRDNLTMAVDLERTAHVVRVRAVARSAAVQLREAVHDCLKEIQVGLSRIVRGVVQPQAVSDLVGE